MQLGIGDTVINFGQLGGNRMKRPYKLGCDLINKDSLLDGFTFEEIIDTLHCNEHEINEEAVRRVVNEILSENLTNMNELLDNNIQEIIKRAKAGGSK